MQGGGRGGPPKAPVVMPHAVAQADHPHVEEGTEEEVVEEEGRRRRSSSSSSYGGDSAVAALDLNDYSGGHGGGVVGAALNLDGYDEATRLEADALLGSGVPRRPSDPLGEASRRGRVMYYYR